MAQKTLYKLVAKTPSTTYYTRLLRYDFHFLCGREDPGVDLVDVHLPVEVGCRVAHLLHGEEPAPQGNLAVRLVLVARSVAVAL